MREAPHCSYMKTRGVPYSLVGSLYFITCDGDVSTTEVLAREVVQANSRIFRDICLLFPDYVHVDFICLPSTSTVNFKK